MKIGYNEATARDCSTLEKDLELSEQLGFDYIEIRLDMLRTYLKVHTVENLRSFFAYSHLKPHAINALYTYPELFSENDDLEKQKSVIENFLLGCMVGKEIGSNYFIIVPPMGEGLYSTSFLGRVEETFKNCVRILKKLSDIALEYSMNLCFEVVGAPCCSVRSVMQADDIVRAVGRDNVGFVFDSYNLYMNGKLNNFGAMSTVDPEKIFAVHINNADDVPEDEIGQDKRCFCNRGVIDLTNYLSVLKKIGYNGMVSIETFRPEYWKKDAEWVIREAYNTTYDILKRNNCI